MKTFCCVLLMLVCLGAARASDDVVIGDFEGTGYGAWVVEGAAFGSGPAPGALPGQMAVTGFAGKGFADSYHGGDDATGKLTSPDFVIKRAYVSFLIGGGGYPGETCLNLVVGGKIVRTAAGTNTELGGTEVLAPGAWDVRDLAGKMAHVEIVDARRGGWGHVNVDEIKQTDQKPALPQTNATRDVTISESLLNFPVANGSAKRRVRVIVGGKAARQFEIGLADGKPDWFAPLDASAWRGRTVRVLVDTLPEGSQALAQIRQSDAPLGTADLYREALRPQIHFSARRGWLNDPNGLSYYNGEYHLFFQHNPYGTEWGNMHWGHAVSKDLVHWQEIGEALYPDALGPMFSGSAVVDWNDSSGFGRGGKPPLVLAYTAAGDTATQCLAYSTDGRTFTKYARNPVVPPQYATRDPKVVWDKHSGQWIMAVYLEKAGGHSVNLLTSRNLRDWTVTDTIQGGAGGDGYLFECPDLFELPVDGDAANTRWVLSAANTEYALGTFDGKKFTPEASRLRGESGQEFYAAQTFSDEPRSRRIQIGWIRADAPGMPFNQCLSLPHVLTLRTTPDGPRLNYQPLPELAALRADTHRSPVSGLRPGDPNPLGDVKGETLEIDATFTPDPQSIVTFTVRGVPITYDAAKQQITVDGLTAPAPLRGGKQTLIIYADRTAYEVFASDGFRYVPKPVLPKPDALGVAVSTSGGNARFDALEAHRLKSIWKDGQAR